jgi:hypothetical protein
MSLAERMLPASSPAGLSAGDVGACIDACFDGAQACVAGADACLSGDMLAEPGCCVTAYLDCADVCTATAQVLVRRADYEATLTRAVLSACRDACRACAERYESHAESHEQFRLWAQACRSCAQSCERLLDADEAHLRRRRGEGDRFLSAGWGDSTVFSTREVS